MFNKNMNFDMVLSFKGAQILETVNVSISEKI